MTLPAEWLRTYVFQKGDYMDQQSELKLKGIVYDSRTNMLGRAIHFIGDTIEPLAK
ncbi:MAG: hypothetical protein MUO63_17300 [Desulfobulbaceae bacterium]|nr:hypothetical protein [Desulfobulbaceae bacterium]